MKPENANSRIDDECRTLGRYLLGQDVNEYVRKKYRSANAMLGLDRSSGRFDRLLLAISVRHRFLAKGCDAYARFFSPHGALRKKMVLLLAIAEVTPPTYRFLDAADAGGRFMFFVRTMGRGAATILCLLPAGLCLLPLHLLMKWIDHGRHRGDAHA